MSDNRTVAVSTREDVTWWITETIDGIPGWTVSSFATEDEARAKIGKPNYEVQKTTRVVVATTETWK